MTAEISRNYFRGSFWLCHTAVWIILSLMLSSCVTPEICRPERLTGHYARHENELQQLELMPGARFREFVLGSDRNAPLRVLDEGTWGVKDTFVILRSADNKRVERWMLINRSLMGISLRACVGEDLLYIALPQSSL